MRSWKLSPGLSVVWAAFAMSMLMAGTRAAAQSETVLYNFPSISTDGTFPESGLILDAAGNLYGTASEGGANGGGAVFEVTPTTGGGWTETTLFSFTYNLDNSGVAGANPYGRLIFDAAGKLYGTTAYGPYRAGTVFELTLAAGGGWDQKVVHAFGSYGTDGLFPNGGLIRDAAGNLYGTTIQGGAYNFGTVFELSPKKGGGWTEKILHSFDDNGKDAAYPSSSLIFDAAGTLYGVSSEGGIALSCTNEGAPVGCGAVFELSPGTDGRWTEKVLQSFDHTGTNPWNPVGSLTIDARGNLYGTTQYGGTGLCADQSETLGCGTVFELSPKVGKGWKETVLHNFGLNGTDGWYPSGGLIFDAAGNLYGPTPVGGNGRCVDVDGNLLGCGTVFELSRQVGGGWTETVIHDFQYNATDGQGPNAPLIFDAAGNLFGTTTAGGDYGKFGQGQGTTFEITP